MARFWRDFGVWIKIAKESLNIPEGRTCPLSIQNKVGKEKPVTKTVLTFGEADLSAFMCVRGPLLLQM